MRSIKNKLTLIISGLVLLSVLLVSLVSSYMLYQSTVEQSDTDYLMLAKAYAQDVYNKIDVLKKQLELVAKDADVLDPSIPIADRVSLLDSLSQGSGFDYISVSDAAGKTYRNSDISEREYFQKALAGTSYLSSPVINKVDGKLTLLIAAPITADGYKGVIYGGIQYEEFINDIVSQITIGDAGYAFLVNREGTVVAHPDPSVVEEARNYIALSEEDAEYASLASVVGQMINGEAGTSYSSYDGQEWLISYTPVEGPEGWSLVVTVPVSQVMEYFNGALFICLMVGLMLILLAIVLSIIASSQIAKPIRKATERIDLLARGDLNTEVDLAKGKDEIAQLTDSLRRTVGGLKGYIQDINQVLSAMASNDFTADSSENYQGDFMPIKLALAHMTSSLGETFTLIHSLAEQFSDSAEQVADSSRHLAQGATEQATAVSNLMNSVVQLTADTGAEEGGMPGAQDRIALNSSGEAQNQDRISQVLAAMEDIKKSAGEIGKITKEIDDIAFQTNILSLNAAVEAARAGSAGKGFAVVAEEVRSLASKSAEAARNTSRLVNTSLQVVDSGYKFATEAILEINRTNSRQSEAIAEIHKNLEQINSVIQTNSATAEQSSAASQQLSSQAVILNEQFSKFKLKKTPDSWA